MSSPPIPQVTLEQYEQAYRGLHLIHAAVDYWAERNPDEAAIVNATRGTSLTWRQLQRGSLALANELWHRGFRAGDYLAASLPLLNEHILLEYACFRLGVIHVPLDLRLPPAEVIRCLGLVRAKGYLLPGKNAGGRFRCSRRSRPRSGAISSSTWCNSRPPRTASPAQRVSPNGCAPRRRGRRGGVCRPHRARWRAGHLHHGVDGLAETGAAVAPRHHLPESVPGHGASHSDRASACCATCRLRTSAGRRRSSSPHCSPARRR